LPGLIGKNQVSKQCEYSTGQNM